MPFKESSLHLFQPPKFRSKEKFYDSFNEALKESNNKLNLDIASIQSIFSFGYICGDRTLLKEVKRQPWLSDISGNKIVLKKIPDHGFYHNDYENLSKTFFNLLLEEARSIVNEYEEIYILLSGGLDSRIVAGIIKYLYDNGELKSQPKAVTWGIKDSRDVVYAKNLAEILNFDWIHIPLTPKIALENVYYASNEMGLMHSPEMLHNMRWFKNLPKNSLVLAGSYGDSIGRAEFSNLHLLQLTYPNPIDKFNLLRKEARIKGQKLLLNDLEELYKRSPNSKKYAHCEHFMQGFRMRGGLCNALSTINGNAKIYQMFTDPRVYKFIWSIHPSYRGDDLYINLFNKFFPKLSKLPWARTNKALGNKTVGSLNGLKLHYHDYTKWSKNELREELETLIDIDWFNDLNLFDIKNLIKLRNTIRKSEIRVGRANDIWFWLAGFRIFIDNINKSEKKLSETNFSNKINEHEIFTQKSSFIEKINNKISTKNSFINDSLKKIRTSYRKNKAMKLKNKFLKKYPPNR